MRKVWGLNDKLNPKGVGSNKLSQNASTREWIGSMDGIVGREVVVKYCNITRGLATTTIKLSKAYGYTRVQQNGRENIKPRINLKKHVKVSEIKYREEYTPEFLPAVVFSQEPQT